MIGLESAAVIGAIILWLFFLFIIFLHRTQTENLRNGCVVLHFFVLMLKKTKSGLEVLHGRLQPEHASVILSASMGEAVCK
jgi:hypothetical protein